MKINKILFPFYAYKQYKELWSRVFNIEDALDWVINRPVYKASSGTGFNGQQFRKQIFKDLLSAFRFDAILETGTYTGDTTGYLSEVSGLPVYTCELNKWYHSIAQMRLKEFSGIHFTLGDSRKFLEKLAQSELTDKNVFIYLDAHWYTDLPLSNELKIISEHWKNFVIMIDDFQVPDDYGYGYDHYSKKKSLRLKTFRELFSYYNLKPFFPAASSQNETGWRRGCVVLAPKGEYSEKLNGIETLRSVDK